MDSNLLAMFVMNIAFSSFNYTAIIGIVAIILLLFVSAIISSSEVAFFSLNADDLKNISETKNNRAKRVLSLLEKPKHLLASLIIASSFVNIAIIVISLFVSKQIFGYAHSHFLFFAFQIIVISVLILLFGEMIPKFYSSQFAQKVALRNSLLIKIIDKFLRPLSSLMVKMTSVVDKRIKKRKINISIDDISQALDIAEADEFQEDKKILEGIVKFGNIDVNEIMKSRVDVISVEISTPFSKLVSIIVDSGYSRIPVFHKTLDNVKGILYVKDLLPHIHKSENFRWQSLIRPPYYVPETKKINDLLEEFQKRKIHMAIVIDEYGGSSGIVTLEDILEEIVGEITDEFDNAEDKFIKIDDNNYIFEGKTLLNDFFKILELDEEIFDKVKGDADTLAGLILEIKGEIPEKHDIIKFENFEFKIKSVDNRRIKQIAVKVKNNLKLKD